MNKEQLICDLYIQGFTFKQIIEMSGVSSKTICKVIKKNNIETRKTHQFIEHKGKKQSLTDWAEELDLPLTTIRSRFDRGWPIEEILFGRKRISPKKKFKSSCNITAIASNNVSGKVS